VTPAEVVALVAAIARAFGLVVEDVVAFARQTSPVLRQAPRPDGEAAADERVRVELERRRVMVTEPDRGILSDWPPPKVDE
jgi:hypothetical protein